MRIVCDLEANGLKPTKIWCIVCIDYDTLKEYIFKQENLHEFIKFAANVKQWIGHNFLCYDMFAIREILKLVIQPAIVVDTLVMSRLFNPIRAGGHSLETFGILLGSLKLEHENWDEYSEEMLQRCIQDTRLTVKVYAHLLNEGKGFSPESIELEHEAQYVLEIQKRNGFYIDQDKAMDIRIECLLKMSEIEQEIEINFKPQPKPIREVTPRIKKDGRYSTVGLCGYSVTEVAGSFTSIEYEKFNLGSPKQVVERMEAYGWKPTVFNKPTPRMKKEGRQNGSPQICEENINTLPETAPKSAKSIGTYLMCKNRANLVSQWFGALGDDKRIHGTMFSVGAITNRCAHINPNMGNIPSIEPDKRGISGRFGYECREVFTVSDKINRRLVGVDAKAIQLRILAHYINDSNYTDAIVNGDPHTYNQQAAGLDTRARAKTFIYAFLLGAGDRKLGQIVEGTATDGKELRERFLNNIPGLKQLRLRCEDDARVGYMEGIDGRRIQVKSAHFALSSYLQGGEAVIMKHALVNSYKRIQEYKLDAMPVAFVHDEFQTDCHKDVAEQVGCIQIEAIRRAGKVFKLNCPLDGEMKIGVDWSQCH